MSVLFPLIPSCTHADAARLSQAIMRFHSALTPYSTSSIFLFQIPVKQEPKQGREGKKEIH